MYHYITTLVSSIVFVKSDFNVVIKSFDSSVSLSVDGNENEIQSAESLPPFQAGPSLPRSQLSLALFTCDL